MCVGVCVRCVLIHYFDADNLAPGFQELIWLRVCLLYLRTQDILYGQMVYHVFMQLLLKLKLALVISYIFQ